MGRCCCSTCWHGQSSAEKDAPAFEITGWLSRCRRRSPPDDRQGISISSTATLWSPTTALVPTVRWWWRQFRCRKATAHESSHRRGRGSHVPRTLIEDFGHQVCATAALTAEAITHAAVHLPDIALMDIDLPTAIVASTPCARFMLATGFVHFRERQSGPGDTRCSSCL